VVLTETSFVFAHLSDPHVPSRLDATIRALLNKRIFGYLSWQLRRRRIHRAHVLDALGHDLAAENPAHIAVTGDIVNIALPAEFEVANRWLASLGPPDQVSVVPGNHDAYVAVPWHRSLAHWGAYMCGDGANEPPSPAAFPYLRRRGALAFIGLSTAIPTAPGLSSGRLGAAQLERLAMHLDEAGAEGRFRVILIHHPPQPTPSPRYKQLADALAFRTVIRRHGAELIVHGHDHIFRFAELPGRDGAVPVVGVPSASAVESRRRPQSQYHLFAVAASASGWSVTLRQRRFDEIAGRFTEAGKRSFTLPRRSVAA
jgi:3',5'-cyclic AMP phosphodiesterase CpdA